MSKLYIPALALALVGGSASAQRAQIGLAPGSPSLSKVHTGADQLTSTHSRPTANQGGARGIAFWTEDFSGGAIPSGWTNEDLLTPVPVGPDDPPVVTFVWSNDPAEVEPAALGYVDSEVFNAPGAGDGYLWCNSDRGLAAAPGTDHLTTLTTTAIDCSGQPSVQLNMQSLIGVFDYDASTNVKVRVSTNMVDWTDFFPFPCLVTGAAAPPCVRWSANPETVGVDITSVAANQSTVYLQFEWLGGWDYFWAIDDIALSPLPGTEIVMNYAYTSQTGTGEEYGRVPLSQVDILNIGCELFNYGGEEQTNVVVTTTVVNSAGGSPFAPIVSNVGTIASGETFIVDETVTLDASFGVEVYTATFEVESDQIGTDNDPTNNTIVRTISVTDDLYSLDGIGIHPSGEVLTQVGTASFTDNAEDVKFMNYYPVNEAMEVSGLLIALGPASVPGGQIVVSILDTTDVFATPADVNSPLVISDVYTITQEDIDADVVAIAFPAPFTLDPGGYYAVASCTGTGTNTVTTDAEVYIIDDGTVAQPGVASALYIPFDPPDNINFYSNGTAWAIRMTSVENISVSETPTLEGVTMYPNPTNGLVNIFTDRSEQFSVEVINLVGEVVMTNTFTGSTKLDLTGFAAGVYNVRVSNSTSSTVQRVTLN